MLLSRRVPDEERKVASKLASDSTCRRPVMRCGPGDGGECAVVSWPELLRCLVDGRGTSLQHKRDGCAGWGSGTHCAMVEG
jgi:hypothetical protein